LLLIFRQIAFLTSFSSGIIGLSYVVIQLEGEC
jgi:hypothetical protein